jgi:hypothetical protein
MLLGTDTEARRERLERERRAGLLHGAENLVATRNLVLVLAWSAFRTVRGVRH